MPSAATTKRGERAAVAQPAQRRHARAERDAARRHGEPQRCYGEATPLVGVRPRLRQHRAHEAERAQFGVELHGERHARRRPRAGESPARQQSADIRAADWGQPQTLL